MESLATVLKRVKDPERRRRIAPATDVPPAETAADPSGPGCDRCDGFGFGRRAVPLDHPDFGKMLPCECQLSSAPDAQTATRAYSNTAGLEDCRFAQLDTQRPARRNADQRLFAAAAAAAREYAADPAGLLAFTGPPGSGKTFLTAAIVNHCLEQGRLAYYSPTPQLLDHLRAAYAPDAETDYDQLYQKILDVPLLALDDFSTRSATPWAQEKLTQLVRHRFQRRLPTVIAVDGPFDRLHESIQARLDQPGPGARSYPLARSRSRLTRQAGLPHPGMLRRMTFAAFNQQGNAACDDEQRHSLRMAYNAAAAYAREPQGWLYLTGPRGCGKTHLAHAVAGQLLAQGHDLYYTMTITLLERLRHSFDPDNPTTYYDLLETVKETDLLIIDDLGSEHETDWSQEKIYQLFVHRYDRELPTVITSIYDREALSGRMPYLASRLEDTALISQILITAPNYRAEAAASRRQPNRPSRP